MVTVIRMQTYIEIDKKYYKKPLAMLSSTIATKFEKPNA